MEKPKLLIVAGPNGSGKTSVTGKILKHEWIKGCEYINPDIIARDVYGDWNFPDAVIKAVHHAADAREECIANRRSLIFETVLSAPDKISFIERAKQNDYFIRLFFIGTDNPQINAARIANRVMEGGHDVPISKIISRYYKSIANCGFLVSVVDRLYIYDTIVKHKNMDTKFITLIKENIEKEHICCAFSDKKCQNSYELKKAWLKKEFDNGYVFRRLDERAKVFIEYVPAEKSWTPVVAPNYLMINCFWVSGQYKGKGYAKALLQSAIDDARQQGKDGLVTVVGTAKLPFMSDTKWLLRQGFETVEKLPYGFSLLALKLNPKAANPKFSESVSIGECPEKNGLAVYYSNRCPFTEYHVHTELTKTAGNRNFPLKIIKFNTMEEAQSSPTPATIFSLFNNGKFVTTDISVCMDSRFDKIIK